MVGYLNTDLRPTASDSKYFVSGSMFVVPGQQTWDIRNLKIIGGDYESDMIKFFKEDGTSKVNDAKAYYYDPDEKKWLYALGASGKQDQEISAEDAIIPAGTGFLALFNTPGAKIEYCGEVIAGTNGDIAIPRGVSRYGLMNNPLPYSIDLTLCRIDDGDYEADMIKFFKKDGTSKVNDAWAYYYDPDVNKWLYALGASGKQDQEVPADEVVIPAGGGFLTLFNSAAAKFVFPAPTL